MIFPWGDHRPDDPEGALWDIVVIGAGLGGGLLGSALAQNGLKTLFLERGPAVSPLPRGRRSIRTRRFVSEAELASRGRWGKLVAARLGGRSRPVQIPLGNGPGGSSAIYAATLERFLREDFEGCAEGEVEPPPMPNRWPISYHELLPYYRKAEEALRVCGSRDPSDPDDDSALRTPPPRFGDSPLSSVLDPRGKVRGMCNLYVADASFMPSISASHPALTVAAHALRVADIITREWWPDRWTAQSCRR